MSSLNPRVKIAVVGVGLIGPRHAKTVQENDMSILTAIVDPAPGGKQLAASMAVAYYQSVSQLVQSPDKPDGAIVCTPNHTHVAVATELIEHGVHVLVEKPISTDIKSGQELVKAAEDSDVRLVVGHHRRFNPYVSAAKRLLESNQVGSVINVNGLWLAYKPIEYFTSAQWRQGGDGGVLLINMIHEVDILQYLLGKIVRAYAEKSISHRGFEAEEGAAMTLRFASGVVGTFLISDHTPSPHNFEAGTGENPLIPRTGETFLQIFGDGGAIAVPSLSFWHYAEAKSWHSQLNVQELGNVEQAVPFQLQLQNFVEVIQGKSEPRCTGHDGLSALAVCEALKKSLQTEQPVYVESMISC